MPPHRRARVARSQNRYQPGGRLSDAIAVYVWNRAAATSATNHFEQLASSACQRKADGKLWPRRASINLAVARFQSGDRDAAVRELKTALEWEPDHPQAAKLLAEAEYGR
jgi:Tfp pilus assembly protein PilF